MKNLYDWVVCTFNKNSCLTEPRKWAQRAKTIDLLPWGISGLGCYSGFTPIGPCLCIRTPSSATTLTKYTTFLHWGYLQSFWAFKTSASELKFWGGHPTVEIYIRHLYSSCQRLWRTNVVFYSRLKNID